MATDSLSYKMYFWFNVPANYFTNSTYPNCPPPPSISFGPANAHAIGKDILGFNALYSPAFLLALNLPLPYLPLTCALGHEPPEYEQRRGRGGGPFAISGFHLDATRFNLPHQGGVVDNCD